MHTVLEKTKAARDEELKGMEGILEMEGESEKRLHLRKTKAAELRIVRNLQDLREPKIVYRAKRLSTGKSNDSPEDGEKIVRMNDV